MQLKILYFASLREALGLEEETLEVPAEVASAGALRTWLSQRDARFAQALAGHRALRMAINKRLAQPESALIEGAEVAFFPPVTGG
jgi:molybdopterin synthase catalytic subunit